MSDRHRSTGLSLIDKSAGPEACWPWMGWRRADGYGEFLPEHKRGTRRARSHRFAYETWVGPIPDGLFVLHKCDNPPCCNPDHLFLGTQADNIADAVSKGRNGRRPFAEGCHRGHPYSGSNLRINSDGKRVCRACSRDRARGYMRAKRASARAAALVSA